MKSISSLLLLVVLSVFVSISANGQAKNILNKSTDYALKPIHPKPDTLQPITDQAGNSFHRASGSATYLPAPKDLPDSADVLRLIRRIDSQRVVGQTLLSSSPFNRN